MRYHCYCGKGLQITYKQSKQVRHEFDAFCSVPCFHRLLEVEGRVDFEFKDHPRIIGSVLEPAGETWSILCNRFFRSTYEKIVAEYLCYEGILWEYEEYSIVLDKKGIKTYTPDFYLPRHRFFIEVKSTVVEGRTKIKMKKAAKLGFNFALLADYIIRKMKIDG